MAEDEKLSSADICADTTPRDRRNLRRFLWALGTWAVLFAGGSQLLKRGLVPEGPLSWMVAALAAASGLLVLAAYSRFLSEADELQRLIQFQALSVGFGGTYFAIAGYQVVARAGAPAADISDVFVVMSLLYSIGLVLGQRRYR